MFGGWTSRPTCADPPFDAAIKRGLATAGRQRMTGRSVGAARLGLVRNGLRRRLVSRCPVMAVAYRARRMAPIGVQLVKDVLRLVNGTRWPARLSWRTGHFTLGAVMPFGSDTGLRLALALTGYHRDRRGSGSPRSPGRRSKRNRGRRCEKDEGQRDVRHHKVLHGASSIIDGDCRRLVSWAGCPGTSRALTSGGWRRRPDSRPSTGPCAL